MESHWLPPVWLCRSLCRQAYPTSIHCDRGQGLCFLCSFVNTGSRFNCWISPSHITTSEDKPSFFWLVAEEAQKFKSANRSKVSRLSQWQWTICPKNVPQSFPKNRKRISCKCPSTIYKGKWRVFPRVISSQDWRPVCSKCQEIVLQN